MVGEQREVTPPGDCKFVESTETYCGANREIGVNRLELAVIGATVNIANRLEAHTRVLNVRLVASRDVVERARGEPGWSKADEDGLDPADPQMIRGVAEPVRTYVVGG